MTFERRNKTLSSNKWNICKLSPNDLFKSTDARKSFEKIKYAIFLLLPLVVTVSLYSQYVKMFYI